jgi:hypothetical protein
VAAQKEKRNKGMLSPPYSPEVYGVVRDARANAPDHLVDTDLVNVVSRDDTESDIFVLYQISLVLRIDRNSVNMCSVKPDARLQPVHIKTHNHFAPDSGVHTRIRQESLLARDIEETAVRDALLWGPFSPRIKMGIKVDDRDGPIDFI